MSIQQPAMVQLGEYGENAATTFFSMIGWGPLGTGRHDVGTDLFVQLRNRDLSDLRMLLGVQVKTGDSWFGEPTTLDGRAGWWYRESDKKHAEYWRNHHVPHILILQTADLTTRVWTVLDARSIEDTGRGIRVFVPQDQSLEASWKPVWIDLVAEARKLISFEGSRWNFSISQVPEDAWFRYALLVPRLVAPHPNRGASADITWAEAVAACISADTRIWQHIAQERESIPSPQEALTHADVGWRTAGAIYQWMFGDTTTLESLREATTSRSIAPGIAICSALSAVDRYELDLAVSHLRRELSDDVLDADQVWLRIHLAQVHRLQGQNAAAREMLDEALAASGSLTYDITTSALQSACVLGLYELTDQVERDVGRVVTAADNSSAWWRTQPVAHGLESHAKKSFKKWARDQSISFGGQSVTHNNIHSAALTARLSGDFSGWRGYVSLLAQTDLLMPPDSSHSIAESLDSLRSVGDKSSLKLALTKVLQDGPMLAIADVASRATPENATSVSILADLALLSYLGSHLDEKQARAWIDVLLAALENPQPFYERFAVRHWAFHEIAWALSGLQRHLNRTDQAALVGFARSLPEGTSQLLDSPLSRLLQGFDTDVIDSGLAGIDLAAQPNDWVTNLIRDVLAPRSESARLAVHASLEAGDLTALRGASDAAQLTSQEAALLLEHCAAAFEAYRQPTNGLAIGGDDLYRLTVVLALHGPPELRERAWTVLVAALTDTVDVQERKHAAMEIIAENPNEIPQTFREGIRDAARSLHASAPSRFWRGDDFLKRIGPVATAATLVLDVDSSDWDDLFATLIAGDAESRRYACVVMANRSGYAATLAALTRDPDHGVSIHAAQALAERATSHEDVPDAYLTTLQELINTAGEALPFAVLSGVARAANESKASELLLRALAEHPSPNVRRGADKVRVKLQEP